MDSDWDTSCKEINGINLDNYFVQKRSFNSVVYVHKKTLTKPEPTKNNTEKVKVKKEKKNKKEKKQDKCQQFTGYSNTFNVRTRKDSYNNNSVLDHTIRFAKNIVPLVIPPDEGQSNIFYTIKTSKKRTEKKPREPTCESHNVVHEKNDPKKVIETYRKVKKESISVRESISQSSNNTLDDLNINQSLCCTFSEVSEKKHHKKDKKLVKQSNHAQKFSVSESFEAVATETMDGDAKIKIHLMNEKDKHFLSDTIKDPILNAIRDCILEINNENKNTSPEISIMQKSIKSNAQKLDDILMKLTCIEKRLEKLEKRLELYVQNQITQENTMNIHEKILYACKGKLDCHDVKLDSHEAKLESHDLKLNSHTIKLECHEEKLTHDAKKSNAEPKLGLNSKENIINICERKADVESRKNQQSILPENNIKSSKLEELGADVIEMDDEFTSEEELHQEVLDRRSKTTVVLDLAPVKTDYKRMEKLGGGEVPSEVKGATSIGTKLERPNRIPARFCWTDAARKS